MEVMTKHFAKALAMGENFVDRNPTFCQTGECRAKKKRKDLFCIDMFALVSKKYATCTVVVLIVVFPLDKNDIT